MASARCDDFFLCLRIQSSRKTLRSPRNINPSTFALP